MDDKKKKRGNGPEDTNQIAFRVVKQATEEKPAAKPTKAASGLKLGEFAKKRKG